MCGQEYLKQLCRCTLPSNYFFPRLSIFTSNSIFDRYRKKNSFGRARGIPSLFKGAFNVMVLLLIIYYTSKQFQQIYIKHLPKMEPTFCINQLSIICFIQNDGKRIARLNQPVQNVATASYSSVLSLSKFILFHEKRLRPPNFVSSEQIRATIDEIYDDEAISHNDLFEPWSKYVGELIFQGKILQKTNTHYFYDIVSQQFLNELQKSHVFLFIEINQDNIVLNENQMIKKQILPRVFNIPEEITKNRNKIIYLYNFATSQLRVNQPYKPKVDLMGLFAGIFYQNQDQWTMFNILKEERPTMQELLLADAVILSGSSHSCHDKVDAIALAMIDLMEAYKNNSKLKIFGSCFGHQLLAHTHGGIVLRGQSRASGIVTINLDNNFINANGSTLEGLCGNGHKVYEYHQEYVESLPQNFKIIGSSPNCKNEAMISLDNRMLSFQFHMEYMHAYARSFQLRFTSYEQNEEPTFRTTSIHDHATHQKDTLQMRTLLDHFLRT